MKTLIQLFASLFFTSFISAQNVGVGTNIPQAPFHIRAASSSEVLRVEGINPYISLYDVNDGYRGFLWYDGLTINLGTAAGSNLPLFISPNLNFSTAFAPDGRVGIGNMSPAHKLDVTGDVNFTGPLHVNGSAGTAGMVLTSNGAGSAPAWATPGSGTVTAFTALLGTSQTVNNFVHTDLINFAQSFEEGGDNFNPASGIFTVPQTGVYHFDVTLAWDIVASTGITWVGLVINGIPRGGCQVQGHFAAPSAYPFSVTLSVNQKLFAGDQVHVRLMQATGAPLVLMGGTGSTTTVFSAFKIN